MKSISESTIDQSIIEPADKVVAASPERQRYVDVFRGLLIAHMALDHASLMFNTGRSEEELAAAGAPHFDNIWQFLTRFLGVPVATGFCFMAGFMIAMTSTARAGRGVTHAAITQRLIIRGVVLILVDAVVMGLPRAVMGFYSFMVLSSIGVAIIAVALVRDMPNRILLPTALGILLLHPLLDVSSLPIALQAVIHEPVRTGAFRSMYPIIPWAAVVLFGFVTGRDALTRTNPIRFWLLSASAFLIAFFVVRLTGGYGNAYGYTSISDISFWIFAKYPPDLAFLTWSFACIFLALAALARIMQSNMPTAFKPLEIFGRVPFFFYIVHFYTLGVAQALVHQKFGLPVTYGIWIALLAAMLGPCRWYYRKKMERPNLITKYL